MSSASGRARLTTLVEPKDDAYTLFAQAMDRSGYARGTLAVQPGLTAPVPALDKVEWLTMADMMGGHGRYGRMDHSAMAGGMKDRNHTAMPMQHNMPGMNHGAMAMDHSQHAMAENPLDKASQTVRHARTEYGPSTDMRVDMPRTNLDDPGIGLRNNGRRVLTLADLSTVGGPIDPRGAEREIELHLTGNMERYAWSRWAGIWPVHASASALWRACAGDSAQRHHDDPPHAPAWHVE